jgi:hypothetical protein
MPRRSAACAARWKKHPVGTKIVEADLRMTERLEHSPEKTATTVGLETGDGVANPDGSRAFRAD